MRYFLINTHSSISPFSTKFGPEPITVPVPPQLAAYAILSSRESLRFLYILALFVASELEKENKEIIFSFNFIST